MELVEESKKIEKIIFSSTVYPSTSSETDAILLAESIRSFAGFLCQTPIWFLVPEYGKQISPKVRDKLCALGVKLIPFEVDHEVMQFPLAAYVLAAALAESKANAQTESFVWLGTNTIVLQEPSRFLLSADKNLGFRPVHHTLVGSHYDAPLDPFWTLIYQYCTVPEDRIFPMKTHIDGITIRPYFNAGMLVTRPEKALFKAWSDTFLRVYQEPNFQEIYRQDERYTIFFHQAVLSGIILSTFTTDEIQELPPTYNYPIHLFTEDITEHRPSSLEELVTIRHEGFYKDPEWMKKMPARQSLKQWLVKRLHEFYPNL